MVGGIRDLEVDSDSDSYSEEDEAEVSPKERKVQTKSTGVFSFFKYVLALCKHVLSY